MPADIDYASIYDSFTITVLEAIEDLGFCEKGRGGAFVAEGSLRAPHGGLPFNTDGGGLCNNHPGNRGGMTKVIEAVRQLRGEAHPAVQVPDCDARARTRNGRLDRHADGQRDARPRPGGRVSTIRPFRHQFRSSSPRRSRTGTRAAEGRLSLQRCADCATVIWYPRGLCPSRGSNETRLVRRERARHDLQLYRRPPRRDGALQRSTPYVLAYVELEEGPRVMTNIVHCDVDSVGVGDAVRAVFDLTGEGSALVRFRPERAEALPRGD